MDLNADLGEGFGAWAVTDDASLLKLVTSANVACGFHAGDPSIMRSVCGDAAARGVAIGAHVGYGDLAGFGRRYIEYDARTLTDAVLYQLAALDGIARSVGSTVTYVKPHGALYHAALEDTTQASAIVSAIRSYNPQLAVLCLLGTELSWCAESAGLRVAAEAFADRAYLPSGRLVPRGEPGATVTDPDEVAERAVRMAVDGQVVAIDGAVRAGEARVTFEHAFDMKQAGQPLRLVVWRSGREVALTATSRRLVRLDNQRNRYGIAPRYLVYAGLVFMPLDRELMKTLGRGGPGGADRNLVWHHLYREAEQPETVNREVVVLTRVLRHPVNSQMTFPGPVAVSRINGVVLQGLGDVPSALAAGGGRFLTVEYEGAAGFEALDRAQAEAAQAEILKQYGIPKDRNL
jgi:UPF0271 protein